MAAKSKQRRSFVERVIAADQRFIQFLLESDDEATRLPRGAVVIFSDPGDPSLFEEGVRIALHNRRLVSSKAEQRKVPVLVEVGSSSVTIMPTSWEQLAQEAGERDNASPVGQSHSNA